MNFENFVTETMIKKLWRRAGEPESEPHDLAGAILIFLQEPEYFKKLEWSQSWHKLVRLQQFLKIL